jgi:hypothetical protein
MKWYVYKCNSRNDPHQNHYGDWQTFFDRTSDGSCSRWGTPDVVPALSQLTEGDKILAYQTDRNSLMGLVVVDCWGVEDGCEYVYLRPCIRLGQDGVKVRPMKKVDATIAAIHAFKTNEVKTLYDIDPRDAEHILEAARDRCRPMKCDDR